jgi:lipopolysaccharide biosynthesis glycosyltransferase
MKKNLIVTLANSNYIDQAKQLFSSVYYNSGWDGDYLLLAHEISDKDLKWFKEKNILIYECKKVYDKKINNFHPLVFDKFYLFTPYFKQWENIIFLDADIIVNSSLKRLVKINKFLAVKDTLPHLYSHFYPENTSNTYIYKKLKKRYNLRKKAFNAGVMAFDTSVIKNETFNNLMSLLDSYDKIIFFAEQAILNLYFYNNWCELPVIYNVPNFVRLSYSYNVMNLKPAIIHSWGKKKFWLKGSQFNRIWEENLIKAEFIDLNKIQNENNISNIKKIVQIIIIKNKISIVKMLVFSRGIYCKLLKLIGKIGIFIKKCNPSLYYKLKGINNNIRMIGN